MPRDWYVLRRSGPKSVEICVATKSHREASEFCNYWSERDSKFHYYIRHGQPRSKLAPVESLEELGLPSTVQNLGHIRPKQNQLS